MSGDDSSACWRYCKRLKKRAETRKFEAWGSIENSPGVPRGVRAWGAVPIRYCNLSEKNCVWHPVGESNPSFQVENLAS